MVKQSVTLEVGGSYSKFANKLKYFNESFEKFYTEFLRKGNFSKPLKP